MKIKKLTLLILLFYMIAILFSCGVNRNHINNGGIEINQKNGDFDYDYDQMDIDIENIVSITPEYPQNISFDDYQGRNKVYENNTVEQDFMNSVKSFAFTSAAKIFTDPKNNLKNTIYSPVSLYMALAVASTGAENQTKNEMFNLLGVSGKDKNYLSRQTGNLFRILYFKNDIGSLQAANSLWMQNDWNFKSDFTDNAVKNFYSSIYNVDFKDKNTAKLMGKWVSDNTNGVIKPEIITDAETILAILNTVYFKDEWLNEIHEDNTKKDKFYLDNKNKNKYVECDFMQTYANSYIKGDGFISSYLGLKNGGRMIFILPDKDVKIDRLLNDWYKFDHVLSDENSKFADVTFKIPKFSCGNKLDLKDVLISLGMEKAFDGKLADFSAMTDDTAFISDVKQETRVAIDEKGVEAAAFTSILYCGAAMPTEKINMVLDKPFIYLITDRNNAILFMGVIYNPAEN